MAFLLGKPLRPDAVLSEVYDRLHALSIVVKVYLARSDRPLPSWLLDSTLIVQRSLAMRELRSALRLETAGARFCNRVAATIAVRDRALTVRKLVEAGVPVPATTAVASWLEVIDLAGQRPVVVKAADQATGRGRGVLKAGAGNLPPYPPFDGPYIVQDYIRSAERDYKVYVVGRQARGLIKNWSSSPAGEKLVEPFAIDRKLADLAQLVGTALELEIYGVDFLCGPNGPVAVDVNPFPGFHGVPQAAPLIARYLTAVATGQEC